MDGTSGAGGSGGRTIGQVMEDMQGRRGPDPAAQFMAKLRSPGIMEARAMLMSAARSYADEIDAAASAAGLTGDEKDVAVANQLGDVLESVSDNLVEGAVEGRQATDVLATRKAPEAVVVQAQGPGTYVPDERGAVNMWREQAGALGRGDAVKTLQYSAEQLRAMRPGDATRAASMGMLSDEGMVSFGIDPDKARRDQAMRFGATPPGAEARSIPKAKVLPEYKSSFEAMDDKGSIVTSMEDMETYGGTPEMAEAAATAAEAVKSAERIGKAASLSADIVRNMNKARPDRGVMAEQALNIAGITSPDQSIDGPGLRRFG